MLEFPIYEIIWLDSESGSDWEDFENYQPSQLEPCISIGYLLVEDEEKLVLCGTFTKDALQGRGQFLNDITIPRIAIISSKRLR